MKDKIREFNLLLSLIFFTKNNEAVIPWTQTFFDGNRRTSIVAAGTFLRDNGYELDISPQEENTKLREMLSEIKKYQRDLEPTIMKQLFLYISERMNKYEPKT